VKYGLERRVMLTSLPIRLSESPFPDPVGTGAIGVEKARIGSGCSRKPFKISCTNPSPETVTTASNVRGSVFAFSWASPW